MRAHGAPSASHYAARHTGMVDFEKFRCAFERRLHQPFADPQRIPVSLSDMYCTYQQLPETSFGGSRDLINRWSAEDPVMTIRRMRGPQRMHPSARDLALRSRPPAMCVWFFLCCFLSFLSFFSFCEHGLVSGSFRLSALSRF